MSVSINYVSYDAVKPDDLQRRPCRVIGKLPNIKNVKYDEISKFLAPRVSEEVQSYTPHQYVDCHFFIIDMERCCRVTTRD